MEMRKNTNTHTHLKFKFLIGNFEMRQSNRETKREGEKKKKEEKFVISSNRF